MKKVSLTKRLKSSPLVNPYIAILSALPAVLSIVLLALIPAIVNVVISFTDYSGLNQGFNWVGIVNYIKAFSFKNASLTIWDALKNTIIFSVFTVIIQQFISLGTALLVVRKFKGRSFFRALYFMPTILGISVVGFVWQLMFDPISGPIAGFVGKFGLKSAFLGQDGLAMVLVIIIAIWANFGYAMAIYVAGLQDIPEEIKEAARMDGVSSFQMLRYVTFPLLKNTMVINFWISISGTLAMFDIIFVLTNGSAGTTTFALYFFKLATDSSANQGQAAALSIYFFVFVTTVMLIFNALFRRKEADF